MMEIFIENLFVNFNIILETIIFTKFKCRLFKIIFLSIILSLNVLVRDFINNNNFIYFTLFLSLTIYLLFNPKNIIIFFKYIGYFILIYIEFIGFIIFFTLLFNLKIDKFINRILLYIVVTIVVYFLNNFMWKIWQNNILNEKLSYRLYMPKYGVKFKIYLDTGNFLKDEFGIYEIIILNENKYLQKIKKNKILSNLEEISIKTSTINKNSYLKGYIFDNIVIEKNGGEKFFFKKAIILFTKKSIIGNRYDGLLGINTYINKLKGVNL